MLGVLFIYDKEKNPFSMSSFFFSSPLWVTRAENKLSWLPLGIYWTSSAHNSFHVYNKKKKKILFKFATWENETGLLVYFQCCFMAGERKNGKAIPTLVESVALWHSVPTEVHAKEVFKNHICFEEGQFEISCACTSQNIIRKKIVLFVLGWVQ